MTIETKFDIGQHVWMMFDNRPIEMVVESIQPCRYKKVGGKAIPDGLDRYEIKEVNPSMDPYSAYGKQPPSEVYEYVIFRTKADCVMSLLKD